MIIFIVAMIVGFVLNTFRMAYRDMRSPRTRGSVTLHVGFLHIPLVRRNNLTNGRKPIQRTGPKPVKGACCERFKRTIQFHTPACRKGNL